MKRSVLDILIRIYESLPEDHDFSINEISRKNGITWRIVRNHFQALHALGLIVSIHPNFDDDWKRVKWRRKR